MENFQPKNINVNFFSNSTITIYAPHIELEELDLLFIVNYRFRVPITLMELKLNLTLTCKTVIDMLVVESVENKYKFTILYLVRSMLHNLTYYIFTRTNSNLLALSLQNLYPGFN